MTTFIKTKLKISDDQTNIIKYRLATNIRIYHIKINLTKNHYSKTYDNKAIIYVIFVVVEIIQWFRQTFEVNYNNGFGIPNEFQVERIFF